MIQIGLSLMKKLVFIADHRHIQKVKLKDFIVQQKMHRIKLNYNWMNLNQRYKIKNTIKLSKKYVYKIQKIINNLINILKFKEQIL